MRDFGYGRSKSRKDPDEDILASVREAFDRSALRRICTMKETSFPRAFDLDKTKLHFPNDRFKPDGDFYAFRDNGAKVLAVAHLDTCVWPEQRTCSFATTPEGLVVHSGALDDRLGAYIILDMLPKLGIPVDTLFTTGEESGQSTAQYFQSEKDYNWIIEFDRGGTDVVMYQYDDPDMRDIVEATGAQTATGIFSDISYMGHLGVKAFNWGVGYHDYHSTRGYAYLEDTFKMLAYFVEFHREWADTQLEYKPKYKSRFSSSAGRDGTVGSRQGRSANGMGPGDWRSMSSSTRWWDSMNDPTEGERKALTAGTSVDDLERALTAQETLAHATAEVDVDHECNMWCDPNDGLHFDDDGYPVDVLEDIETIDLEPDLDKPFDLTAEEEGAKMGA